MGADITQQTINLNSLIGSKAIVTVSLTTGANGEEYINVTDVKKITHRHAAMFDSVQSKTNIPVQQQPAIQQNVPVQQNIPVQFQQQQQPQVQPLYQQQPYVPINNAVQQQSQPKVQEKRNPLIEEINNLDELEF